MRVDDQSIEVSNRDKVFFSDAGLTKGDMIDYYLEIADLMIPHIKRHGISMQRFPEGLKGSGFYNKDAPDYFPDWIKTVQFPKEGGGSFNAPVVDKKASLVYLANQAVLTFHPYWGRVDDLRRPDRMIFDLDPPDGIEEFHTVRDCALNIQDVLEKLDLMSWIQTTGSMGFHIHVPIIREWGFDQVRQFAHDVGLLVVQAHQDKYTLEERGEKRKGRVFIDFLRNSYGATSVAPYGVRARPGAPAATPVDWDEVREGVSPRDWNIENIPNRMTQKEDPWKDMMRHVRSLEKRREKLNTLLDEE